jgi:hypothetical protein
VGDEPILVFSGQMRSDMIAQSAVNVTARRMVYEPDAPDYAIYHQTGDDGEGGGPPQRKMVDLPDSTRRQWDRFFHEWLNALRSGPIIMNGSTL